MSDPLAIEFRNVSKRFKTETILSAGVKRMLLNLPQAVKESRRSVYVQALDDVSFQVPRGQCVGVIGRNGSGKSTALGLMAGVLWPTQGTVDVRGHICPLLELGAGFRPELSGAENIFLNGVLLGMTRREVRRQFAAIADFVGLGESLEHPLRTYSSGMVARLGFSIAVHLSPEVLLVDEILAVGDIVFAERCRDKIEAFRRQGVTILLVSHDLNAVASLCDRTIWLENGRVRADGDAPAVTRQYRASPGA